jgi:wyosine [tRNA(Phe)-imidazoG37] synthetase (radical SAM superfamily)
MADLKYVYGPVPSRRLGLSLGVSPIPNKTCNYSCIYCQLGRTNPLTNERKLFFDLSEILNELTYVLSQNIKFDVITIVGEGEPTLYSGLGDLIDEIHKLTEKPVAVITNGALLSSPVVCHELLNADFVLPSLDAVNSFQFSQINRPHKALKFEGVIQGLISFSMQYKGALWVEIMLIDGINDGVESLNRFAEILSQIKYSRLYLNTPLRPPAELGVNALSPSKMNLAVERLGGISIDLLASKGFYSDIKDDYKAILSIIQRHPMNQYEIEHFLNSRNCCQINQVFSDLKESSLIEVIDYKGYETYRIKVIVK